MERLVEVARSFSTDPDGPLRQGRYQSPLRDERVAAILGAALAVLFGVCFATGLLSHLHQNPQSWLPISPRPAGFYRVSQGVHVASGIASIPVLLAKLWVVWPRFVAWPPARSVGAAVERVGLLPLVGGGLFMVFSGVANVARWYPWNFSFTVSHYWVAWVTIGALVAHVGAQWTVARRTFRRSRRPALAEADPVLGTVAEQSLAGTGARGGGLTRRGLLGTVAAASGVLTLTTVGQTLHPLRALALLAPRDPTAGAQGRAVNRTALAAGVVDLAGAAEYRLRVEGRVTTPLSLTGDDLAVLATTQARLPISCVEGWSFTASWRGVAMRDLLARAGAEAGRTVRVESLEPNGAYRVSTLNDGQAADRHTLLATHLDREPLDVDHGFPCRLVAPNRPGVLQTKWVTRLVVE